MTNPHATSIRGQIPNPQRSGVCALCAEHSDRLFNPPLLRPEWDTVEEAGDNAWWHCPGIAYPGKNLYSVITLEDGEFLRGYETPDEPICWTCFDGYTMPAEREYLANKPKQITFHGWHAPVWTDTGEQN